MPSDRFNQYTSDTHTFTQGDYAWRAPTHPRISGEAKHMRLSFPAAGGGGGGGEA